MFDARDLGAEVATVEQRGHGQGVARRGGIEAEGIEAHLVGVEANALDTRVEILAREVLGQTHECVP